MTRSILLKTALVGLFTFLGSSKAVEAGEVFPQPLAARHGLVRMWWAQVELDRTRGRVSHVLLEGGTLFVQTDRAMLQALDAETGQTLWAVEVGRRDLPSFRPAASRDMVATINGSHVYLANRHNGKLLWETEIDGAPGAGPALCDDWVYVPCVDGRMLAYRIERAEDPRLKDLDGSVASQPEAAEDAEDASQAAPAAENAPQPTSGDDLLLVQEHRPPLACPTQGRAIVQPIVTREDAGDVYVAWPTDRGFLFVARLSNGQSQFSLEYRLETRAGIAAQPSYLPPDAGIAGDTGVIFAASRDGDITALAEDRGTLLWRFSTGEPLVEPAVVVDTRVFAATQRGGMYCLDAKTGQQITSRQLWWSPSVTQFIAASRDRLYVVDRIGQMRVLDIKTGARLDTIPYPKRAVRMYNDQTDRIYLVTETGLVQCLREIENVEPVLHNTPAAGQPASPAAPPAGGQPPGEGQPNATPNNPFGVPASENPFAPGER